jgi:uncharacterized protein
VKIEINKIPPEGLTLVEELSAGELDLVVGNVKFYSPVQIKAEVERITNAVTAHLTFRASMSYTCSRCLEEYAVDFNKRIKLSYPVNKGELIINLDPDIREEIILDYPLKPLCKPGCKGLCIKCGKNLNEGKCYCS